MSALSGPVLRGPGLKNVLGLPSLLGCRSSLPNSLLITTSGSSGLDHAVGGGFPVGSLICFEDRPFSYHAKSFLQVFAAEGLRLNQKIAVAAQPDSKSLVEFIGRIPTAKEVQKSSIAPESHEERGVFHGGGDQASGDLKIAWRYENVPKVNAVLGNPLSRNSGTTIAQDREFDLGKSLCESESSLIAKFSTSPSPLSCKIPFHEELIKWLRAQCEQSGSSVLRICLPQIDSPLWGFEDIFQFCRFLLSLRSIVRSTNSIICFSICSDLHEKSELSRIRRFCDAHFLLESLDEASKSVMFKDFQAIFRIQKSFAINSLKPALLLDHEFGYRIKRRKIVLERLHLPPALADDSQKGTSDLAGNSGNCNAAHSRGLDF